MDRPPRVPERTCIACRGKAGKRELLRLVRSADGAVRADPTGSAPGRGAYVHRDAGCVDLALAKGSLGKALRTGLGPEEAARLRRNIEGESAG